MGEFRDFFESTRRPGAKQSLYPLNYGGVGQYAPADWIPYAADSITYMPPEWLNFKFLDTFYPPPLANRMKDVKYTSLPYRLP